MFANFVMTLKDYLLKNYKILLLSLLLACLSFPNFSLFYTPVIDGPLSWVFNYLADGHFEVGQFILFPHGPLAFLLYPLGMGNNVNASILIYLLISSSLSFSVFKIYFLKKQTNYLVPSLLLLILLSALDLQLQVTALCLSQFILFELKQNRIHLLFALLFCVFNLYIKTYGGVICLLLSASVFFSLIVFQKKYKEALYLILSFFVFFFILWIALYQGLSGSLHFLRGQVELSTDNSEAASFYQVNNWWCIGICFLAVVVMPFFTKDRLTKRIYFFLLLPLFAAWKHGLSRGDETHVSGFLSFLFLFCFMLWLLSEENRTGILFCGIVSMSAFTLNMASTSQYNDFSQQKNMALFKPFNLYNLLFYQDSIVFEKNKISKIINSSEILPDSLRRHIQKQTVDVFPWNHSIIAMNRLNWVPRPTLHSYAAYTSWLDKQNALHYLSEQSAEYVLWKMDQLDGGLHSIDSRYLLNDAPQAIIAFYCRYSLVYKDSRYMLYHKNNLNMAPLYKTLIANKKIKYENWLAVPAAKKNSILRAKLNIHKSFQGLLKSAFYKGESFSVYYELENGKILSHKIVPKNAQDGIWIHPLIVTPETNESDLAVKRIKVKCWDKHMVTKEVEIEFEEIVFEKETDLLKRCFGKKDGLPY